MSHDSTTSAQPNGAPSNRRRFLQHAGGATAGASLLSVLSPRAFAAEDQTIRLALIGCGNRGSGAVRDALSVTGQGPIELHAMADISEESMTRSHRALQQAFGEKVNVAPERMFVGFDSYRKAIDLLRPGDVAMCTTRAYIRPVHVEYAVQKGINVFMEKPFASDPRGLHRMLRAGEQAAARNVKIAAGLQCRHSPARQALIQQVRDGELGELLLIRANRLGSANWLKPHVDGATDLVSQLQFGKIHLLWVGSGHMVDNLIHQIDECCWLKDAWPIKVDGLGGRVPRSPDAGQNIDVYSMEYTFADGTKALCGFRRIRQARTEFATFVHGTRAAAQFSGETHAATVHSFRDQRIDRSNIAWTPEPDALTPWQYEWNDFIASIRDDLPHNECERAVYADFASIMGRAACHMGQTVTWEQILQSDFAFCEDLDSLTYESPVPVQPGIDGSFPVPIPGLWSEV
jgi:predicted dehydrogenase